MSALSTLVQWVCTHKSLEENEIRTTTTRRLRVDALCWIVILSHRFVVDNDVRADGKQTLAIPR